MKVGARLRRARALRAKAHIHDCQEEGAAPLGQAGRCSLCRGAADIAAPWEGTQNRVPRLTAPHIHLQCPRYMLVKPNREIKDSEPADASVVGGVMLPKGVHRGTPRILQGKGAWQIGFSQEP